MKKKKYRVLVQETLAHVYLVEAKNEDEALELAGGGEGVCIQKETNTTDWQAIEILEG